MSAPRAPARRVEAVVIGASSGGIDALLQVLPAIPTDARVPVLVVLHLPGHHDSLLVEIFAPRCELAVLEAQDKEPVLPGRIYVAPPNYHLLVESERVLALSLDEPVQFSRPSIDVLFESAADVYGEDLLAIVLTGAGSDGAEGMRTVQARGGITLVQDPGSARMSSMPESVLRGIVPDYCLSLENIALLLRSLNSGVAHEPVDG